MTKVTTLLITASVLIVAAAPAVYAFASLS